MDYMGFVVQIFLERARQFYDLERLWRSAPRLPIPEEG
jgi:ribosomal silencing factor RsfS